MKFDHICSQPMVKDKSSLMLWMVAPLNKYFSPSWTFACYIAVPCGAKNILPLLVLWSLKGNKHIITDKLTFRLKMVPLKF